MQLTTLNIIHFIKSRVYYILLACILTLFVAGVYFALGDPSKLFLFYLSVLLLFVLDVCTTRVIIKRHFPGCVRMRRMKRSFNYYSVLLVCICTINYLMAVRFRVKGLFLPYLLVFYMQLVAEIISVWAYRYFKPVTLVIDGTQMFFNDKMVIKRNLENLTAIKLNDMESGMLLYFEREWRITIVIKEFLQEDLLAFINAATAISIHKVQVQPFVYKKLLPSPSQPRLPFFKRVGKGLKDALLP